MPPSSVDLTRLKQTLGVPVLTPVVDALQRRTELGRPLTGRLTLTDISPELRRSIDDLLGRSSTPGRSLVIALDELAYALHESGIAPDLASAVIALRGPLVNRLAAQEECQRTWAEVANHARRVIGSPVLAAWLNQVLASGLLRRLSDNSPSKAKILVDDLGRLLSVLPVTARPLPSLAAEFFGDAHGLDLGQPRATLAVRLAAVLGQIEFQDDAEGRRAAWASCGVMCDELSTPVLVFNLPSANDTPLGRRLRQAQTDCEPQHLTLRLLLRFPLNRDPAIAGQSIYVCENPTIVALAVTELGQQCAPLVCVNGQFATPSLILLRQLREAGARLHYHGDFDPAGIAIARRAMKEGAAIPWRYGAQDYQTATPGVRLSGTIGSTPWDPKLRELMESARRVVHEEAVAVELLSDLRR